MVRYSALLGLLQKWNKEAAQLEVKAERTNEMERSYLLTTAEALRGCQRDLSAVLFDMLDLAVEEDRQAFLALQRERGKKRSPEPDSDK